MFVLFQLLFVHGRFERCTLYMNLFFSFAPQFLNSLGSIMVLSSPKKLAYTIDLPPVLRILRLITLGLPVGNISLDE